jgi:hypothetical protein
MLIIARLLDASFLRCQVDALSGSRFPPTVVTIRAEQNMMRWDSIVGTSALGFRTCKAHTPPHSCYALLSLISELLDDIQLFVQYAYARTKPHEDLNVISHS